LLLALAAILFLPTSLRASGKDLDEDGRPNATDPDVDNDGLPNGQDRNVDGGRCRSGRFKGRSIGDRLPNGSKGELDIDADGRRDDADAEKDMDGDRLADDSSREDDIDGDGRLDDDEDEDDIDGDGRLDDDEDEDDIDGDGRLDDDEDEDDIDGDGRRDDDEDENDIDGDGLDDDSVDEDDTDGDGLEDGIEDDDDDGDGFDDDDDFDDDGDDVDDEDEVVAFPAGRVGDGNAPASLSGLTYEFVEGDDPETEFLGFTSGTAGNKTEGTDVDPFTYIYGPNGTIGVATVTYDVGEYDEFTFDFSAGTFVRKRFEDSVLERTKDGNFRIPPP
jgi:hypothetical protein